MKAMAILWMEGNKPSEGLRRPLFSLMIDRRIEDQRGARRRERGKRDREDA